MVMGETQGYRTFVEEIPDHDCHLDTKDVVEGLLFGDGYRYGLNSWRIFKCLKRSILLSRKHPYTNLYFKSTSSITLEILRHWKVSHTTIHPFSIFRSNWDIVMMIYYITFYVSVPFLRTFNSKRMEAYLTGDPVVILLDYIMLMLLLFSYVDATANFFSGYVSDSGTEIVLDKKRIAKRYFKTYFFVDVLSGLPINFVLIRQQILSPDYIWIELIALLKIFRLCTLLQYFRQVSKRFKMGYLTHRITILLTVLFLYLHWLACTILFVSTILGQVTGGKPKEKSTWAEKMGFMNMQPEQMWRRCLLRAVCFTFGCGSEVDISQVNDLYISILASAMGIIVSAIVAVHVVMTARTSRADRIVFEELQRQLHEYLKYKKVPRLLKNRISDYFRFCYEKNYYDELSIMTFLSGQLRQDVLLHKSRRLVETVRIFAELPPLLAVRLVACMRDEVALANEVVTMAGAVDDRLFYIFTGTVAIFSVEGSEVCHLHEGAHFGEASLVLDEVVSEVSAVALETTRLWTVTRSAFLHAVAPDAAFMNQLRRIAHRRYSTYAAHQSAVLPESQLADMVRHLRRTHRAAQEERRLRAQKIGKSILEHEVPPDVEGAGRRFLTGVRSEPLGIETLGLAESLSLPSTPQASSAPSYPRRQH